MELLSHWGELRTAAPHSWVSRERSASGEFSRWIAELCLLECDLGDPHPLLGGKLSQAECIGPAP